jgi:diacylglycerol O-acyltransferase
MTNYFPVSIPSNGSVLNITVQSYLDKLDFGLIACRTAVPDIESWWILRSMSLNA